MLTSEWADNYRYLSPEASAEPGLWRTARAEFLRAIMDAHLSPEARVIVVIKPSQIGVSEVILNLIAYFIDQDPCPMLATQPTLQIGQAFSKDRVSKMLRDSPQLRGKVRSSRNRDSNNTILHKEFPGGHLTIGGANSPASLASRPVRVYLGDEVDRYPKSAGTEGDPVDLAIKRTTTFWNSLVFLCSTPTDKGFSRIEKAFKETNMQFFYVPCPHCKHYQRLFWENVVWEKGKGGAHITETAKYQCSECGTKWRDAERWAAVQSGKWMATRPDIKDKIGFAINGIYSPWLTLAELADEFLEAKKSPERLKVFVNTRLGETFEVGGLALSWETIAARREVYPAEVPQKALVLTAGIDVQNNRLEMEVKGWGIDQEVFGIDYLVIPGDPSTWDVWAELDERLKRVYEHETGIKLRISCACIDTGGHWSQMVYDFVRPREHRRIFAIKGANQVGQPLVSRPSTSNKGKVSLFMIGTDTAKEIIYSRLQRIHKPGPAFAHFPDHYDDEYFRQLVSEKALIEEVDGKLVRKWRLEEGKRNESLDVNVYALAAYHILNPNMQAVEKNVNAAAARLEKKEDPEPDNKGAGKPLRRQGWINKYKGI